MGRRRSEVHTLSLVVLNGSRRRKIVIDFVSINSNYFFLSSTAYLFHCLQRKQKKIAEKIEDNRKSSREDKRKMNC